MLKKESNWLETTIKKAKEKVAAVYHNTPEERPWLEASIDSYKHRDNRVTMLIFEGSPPKGMIIINYGHGLVMAFDAWGKRLYTWRSYSPL